MSEDELKELKSIKKLLMLWLKKQGVTSEELDQATGMGAGNIRAMFPTKKSKKKSD